MKDRSIKSGGEQCPCGTGLFRRIARCNESTDHRNLHYDICSNCGFATYAHNPMAVKVAHYRKWKQTDIDDSLLLNLS